MRAERESLLRSCRALPPAEVPDEDFDLPMHLIMTVLDYQLNTTILQRAATHYRQGIGRRVCSLEDLEKILSRFPDTDQGNTDAAVTLWGYRYSKRLRQLRRLIDFMTEAGVRDKESLRTWAATSDFERDFKGRVHGLAFAVYQFLVMRQGVDTAKPDLRLHRFVSRVIGHDLPDQELVDLVKDLAAELGITARELDLRMWEAAGR